MAVVFDRSGAVRIANAVRYVEGLPISSVGPDQKQVADAARVIVLDLVEDGDGADGDSDAAPTYTYTATRHDSGAAFETGLSPLWARTVGSFEPATLGVGFVDGDGEKRLLICDEVPNLVVCEDAGIPISEFVGF